MIKYRREIDGLRAVAVLPVMLFHAGISAFSGGYVGVDIFFVISGYLITATILEEKRNNKYSIWGFYERRARRILPALSFVLMSTTIAAYMLMPADLLNEYSQSLISVSTFVSNMYFFKTTDYFAQISVEMPLLHTWSLAVEEQYYLFFPVMFTWLWSFSKKYVLPGMLLITMLSLACAQFLSFRNAHAYFYLIFNRAWELLFGSIIAFILSAYILNIGRSKRELLGILGLAMIAYSVVFFDQQTPFPSFYTLLPVLGTGLIIVFTDSRSLVGRVLSHKILVSIGLISYSLYLWHQPLFAFLRLKSIGEPSTLMFIGAIAGTFLLAFVSWKYVEKPFRNKSYLNRARIFQFSIASIVIFFLVGVSGESLNGLPWRFNVPNYADSIKFSPKRTECHTSGENYLRPRNACKYFGENITWASFGDSHTVEPAYALAERLEKDNQGLVQLSFSGCPPALLFEVKLPGCTKWVNESLIYLEDTKTIKNILLGFRYSSSLYGVQLYSYPELPDINPCDQYIHVSCQSAMEAREIYWMSFETIVSRLIKAGKNVYILYPIPELPTSIDKAVIPFSILGNTPILDLEKTTSAEYYFRRNEFIISKLNSLPYSENLRAIKPFEIICDGKFCPAIKDGKALYFDDNHLSVVGAELVINSISLEK